MLLQYLLVAFYLAPLSTAIRFQGRGSANHTAALYSNSTTTAQSSTCLSTTASSTESTVAPAHYDYVAGTALSTGHVTPRPTGTGAAYIDFYDATLHNSTKTSNASCTVNIPDASLEWWYPATYTHPLATLTSRWGNFSNIATFTFVPHTTTFEPSGALQTQDVCTSGWTTYTEWDWTAWACLPYTEKPTAASTVMVYRTAVPPIPSGGVIPMSEVWPYDILLEELPSMTIAISVAPEATVIETAPTPFVHFTAYEVERNNVTETIQLNSAFVQSYSQKNIEHEVSVTGSIPDGFMGQIPQSACDVGSLRAVVTVLVLVDMYYINQPEFGPGVVHWESSALGWEDEIPLGVMDQTSSSGQPQIITGWDLSAAPTQPARPANTGPHNPVQTKPPQPASSVGQTVGAVGTAPVVIGPSSVVIIGSQTLRPGAPAVTVGGTPVALAPAGTAIIVGGTSLPLPQNQRPEQQQTVGTLGTVPVVIGPSSVVVVGSQTLQPGGAPVILGPGTTVSLAPSGAALVIGGTTSLLSPVVDPATKQAPPILTIGTTTLVPNAATQFFIGPGQTLTPGGTAVVDGTTVSLDPSAAFVVVGSSTQLLPAPGTGSIRANTVQSQFVLDGTTFTVLPTSNNPNDGNGPNDQGGLGPTFVVSGQTLTPGGAPITVSGRVLSLAPSGSFLVIDGSTSTFAAPTAVAAAHVTPPPLTIGNGVFRPLPGTGTTYQIGTALLTPGGSIVVAGTTISLAVGATALVVNGVTTTLEPRVQPVVTNPPLLTVGDQTYTAAPGTGTAFIIGGQTLTPGGTITVDGTTIVLSPHATELAYGSSGRTTRTALFPATTTRGSTTVTLSASEGQGRDGQASPTSSREGMAPQSRLQVGVLLGAMGCLGWLFI